MQNISSKEAIRLWLILTSHFNENSDIDMIVTFNSIDLM